MRVDDLLQPLPSFAEPEYAAQLKTTLLWDHLYPTIEDFAVALVQNKLQALARLVEVYGLFSANALLGKVVWKLFPKYKKFLPSVRRKQCEQIWLVQFQKELILNLSLFLKNQPPLPLKKLIQKIKILK